MSAQPDNTNQFSLSAVQIACITGSPVENVQLYWPVIVKALEREEIADRLVMIAVLATMAVEDPAFKPIDEYGNEQYFTSRYEHRRDLGNVFPGDGARYHGRGFIQLTGRSNYYMFGQATGTDLMGNPELALNPIVAARVLAVYFKILHVVEAAHQQDWRRVRFLVNGGLNGFERYMAVVERLLIAS